MGVKCDAAATMATSDEAQTMSLTSAVAHLNAISSGVSVDPAEYSWGAPSLLQQQALYSQFLQLACSLPQLQYAHMSGLHAGRAAFFSGFMPPFVAPPCLSQAPSPAPCSPAVVEASAQQQVARPSSRSDVPSKVGSPIKKAGSKARPSKCPAAQVSAPAPTPKVEADMQLEDICRLLGDDAFLEHLQDDVLSEGSNGSSATSEGRVLSKNGSDGSLCASGSLNNGDNNINFASAFDLDMDEAPAPAATPSCTGGAWAAAPSASQPPSKTNSGDLNNMVASGSPVKSTRASRSAAREAAAAAAASTKEAMCAGAATAGGAGTAKASLKVKGGVQKASGAKSSKAAAQLQAAVAAAPVPPATTGTASCPEECQLTAADISRLLGEDDNRIPDGWDLDLDFQDPFSCSISA